VIRINMSIDQRMIYDGRFKQMMPVPGVPKLTFALWQKAGRTFS
jgi:hypothetical protein